MRLDLRILGLPASILFLLASRMISTNAAQDEESPVQLQGDLPIQKRLPPDSPQRRRQLEAVEEHLRLGRSPVGVLKMSSDEGEKFYMDYWQFEGELEQSQLLNTGISLRARDEEEEARLLANSSATVSFRPPFALHTEEWSDTLGFEDLRARNVVDDRSSAAVLAMLTKRGFQCPTGTANCTDAGFPNSCCPTTEFCYQIQDTGLGPVGCCPNGSVCGGTISPCNAPNTACDDNSFGGGCCIPNFVCAGIGCVINSTLVTTIVVTHTFTVSASSTGRSTQTTTVVSTLTSSTSSSSLRSTSTSVTGTATGSPPVRPTSDTLTSTSTQDTGPCPTGFYGCSATYGGGCCRTFRNCDITSCPAGSSTTIVSSGVTLVVPVGPAATVNSPTGSCATGWTTCDASLGGNCCPSNFQCGTATCSSAAATSTAFVQKESPSAGFSSRGVGAFGAMIMTFMLGLILV
ncbi:uncharacterized protein K444DRAFT_607419 [Hyaloscypha bicolor E]|uniref:GPI anchored protein n=1 Tax=Hyaloscypha bicolor E TaxID=1095630 RepID=A0A2J6TSL4_9HELO|nr:uncharacterized protein K444DRAFT_607419 [Hyaloscypha bicolor E]PMD66001.1 hypothetical protein K444DRAFT_607419 [Hyaloscypha bicolor E]